MRMSFSSMKIKYIFVMNFLVIIEGSSQNYIVETNSGMYLTTEQEGVPQGSMFYIHNTPGTLPAQNFIMVANPSNLQQFGEISSRQQSYTMGDPNYNSTFHAFSPQISPQETFKPPYTPCYVALQPIEHPNPQLIQPQFSSTPQHAFTGPILQSPGQSMLVSMQQPSHLTNEQSITPCFSALQYVQHLNPQSNIPQSQIIVPNIFTLENSQVNLPQRATNIYPQQPQQQSHLEPSYLTNSKIPERFYVVSQQIQPTPNTQPHLVLQQAGQQNLESTQPQLQNISQNTIEVSNSQFPGQLMKGSIQQQPFDLAKNQSDGEFYGVPLQVQHLNQVPNPQPVSTSIQQQYLHFQKLQEQPQQLYYSGNNHITENLYVASRKTQFINNAPLYVVLQQTGHQNSESIQPEFQNITQHTITDPNLQYQEKPMPISIQQPFHSTKVRPTTQYHLVPFQIQQSSLEPTTVPILKGLQLQQFQKQYHQYQQLQQQQTPHLKNTQLPEQSSAAFPSQISKFTELNTKPDKHSNTALSPSQHIVTVQSHTRPTSQKYDIAHTCQSQTMESQAPNHQQITNHDTRLFLNDTMLFSIGQEFIIVQKNKQHDSMCDTTPNLNSQHDKASPCYSESNTNVYHMNSHHNTNMSDQSVTIPSFPRVYFHNLNAEEMFPRQPQPENVKSQQQVISNDQSKPGLNLIICTDQTTEQIDLKYSDHGTEISPDNCLNIPLHPDDLLNGFNEQNRPFDETNLGLQPGLGSSHPDPLLDDPGIIYIEDKNKFMFSTREKEITNDDLEQKNIKKEIDISSDSKNPLNTNIQNTFSNLGTQCSEKKEKDITSTFEICDKMGNTVVLNKTILQNSRIYSQGAHNTIVETNIQPLLSSNDNGNQISIRNATNGLNVSEEKLQGQHSSQNKKTQKITKSHLSTIPTCCYDVTNIASNLQFMDDESTRIEDSQTMTNCTSFDNESNRLKASNTIYSKKAVTNPCKSHEISKPGQNSVLNDVCTGSKKITEMIQSNNPGVLEDNIQRKEQTNFLKSGNSSISPQANSKNIECIFVSDSLSDVKEIKLEIDTMPTVHRTPIKQNSSHSSSIQTSKDSTKSNKKDDKRIGLMFPELKRLDNSSEEIKQNQSKGSKINSKIPSDTLSKNTMLESKYSYADVLLKHRKKDSYEDTKIMNLGTDQNKKCIEFSQSEIDMQDSVHFQSGKHETADEKKENLRNNPLASTCIISTLPIIRAANFTLEELAEKKRLHNSKVQSFESKSSNYVRAETKTRLKKSNFEPYQNCNEINSSTRPDNLTTVLDRNYSEKANILISEKFLTLPETKNTILDNPTMNKKNTKKKTNIKSCIVSNVSKKDESSSKGQMCNNSLLKSKIIQATDKSKQRERAVNKSKNKNDLLKVTTNGLSKTTDNDLLEDKNKQQTKVIETNRIVEGEGKKNSKKIIGGNRDDTNEKKVSQKRIKSSEASTIAIEKKDDVSSITKEGSFEDKQSILIFCDPNDSICTPSSGNTSKLAEGNFKIIKNEENITPQTFSGVSNCNGTPNGVLSTPHSVSIQLKKEELTSKCNSNSSIVENTENDTLELFCYLKVSQHKRVCNYQKGDRNFADHVALKIIEFCYPEVFKLITSFSASETFSIAKNLPDILSKNIELEKKMGTSVVNKILNLPVNISAFISEAELQNTKTCFVYGDCQLTAFPIDSSMMNEIHQLKRAIMSNEREDNEMVKIFEGYIMKNYHREKNKKK